MTPAEIGADRALALIRARRAVLGAAMSSKDFRFHDEPAAWWLEVGLERKATASELHEYYIGYRDVVDACIDYALARED